MPLGRAGESRAYGSVARYIQGPGELRKLATICKGYGDSALLIIDPFFFDEYAPMYENLFKEENIRVTCVKFSGACSDEEINRITEISKTNGGHAVYVGIGGGRAVDTSKGVADLCDGINIVCPTALSTDAATSIHSVVYRPDLSYYLMVHKKNPDLVLVDTDVTIASPARMFAAGMGDALATYIEARACEASDNVNNIPSGYRRTRLGMAIAKLSFDILMEEGRDAYLAACHHIRTEAYEDVAEANTLLSGVGFENTGCVVAHGLQAAFATLPQCEKYLHGEQVAFGCLCQLALENRPHEEFEKVFNFCKDINLPTSLAEIGITENVESNVESVVKYGIENKAILKIEPFVVTEARLKNAIYYVDAYSAHHSK